MRIVSFSRVSGRYRKTCRILLIALFLIGFNKATADVLDYSDGNSTDFIFNLSLSSLEIERDGNFTTLHLPGEDCVCGNTGAPGFPAIRRFLPIPEHGSYSVEIEIGEIEHINLPEIGFPGRVFPCQPEVPKHLASLPFEIKESWYADSLHSLSPQAVATLTPAGTIRGQRVGKLEIKPVIHYDPKTGALEYIRSARIIIRYDSPITAPPNRLLSEPFMKIMTDIFPIPVEIPSEPDMPIVFWIIYYDDFFDALAPFIDWKTQMGYDVTLTPISEIGYDADALAIAIQEAYDTWADAPDFVLLVGDIEQIPSTEAGMHVTDLYFFTVDGGDYLPDILYGRFPCATSEEVSALVEKTVYYEKFMFTSTAFLNHPVFAACGTDGDWELAESTHRYVFETWLTPPEFEPESIWANDGATGADVIAALNTGTFILNYSGHGWENGWGNPELSSADIYSLTNEGMYPYVISNACLTGSFNESECFGEAWVRAPLKGAIGFTGATNSTYWGPDDVWERRFFDAIFDEGYTTVAGAIYIGNIAVDLTSEYGDYYFEVYHHFGDPSLWLYWGEPTELAVDLSEWEGIIPLGDDIYEIPVSEDGALVAFWRDSEKFGLAVSEGGYATFEPEFMPTEPGSILIVATKPNFFAPFILTAPNEYLSIVEYSPESLLVNSDNYFEITILSGEGAPYVDVLVIIEGLEFAETTYTDASGFASMIVNPPYGFPAKLSAYDGDSKILGKELTVYGALDWTPESLDAYVTSIELEDSFAVGFPSTVDFTVSEGDFRCYIFSGGVEMMTDFSENSGSMGFTPDEPGYAAVLFAKEGYIVLNDTIPVINAVGPFTGVVVDTMGELVGERPKIVLMKDSDTMAVLRADWDGYFALPGFLSCDTYTVAITGFGYHDTTHTFLLTTRGEYEFALNPTARSAIYIQVKDDVGMPVSAEVMLIEPISGELIAIGEQIDPGVFSLSEQPFYEYYAVARCRGFSPGRIAFSPDSSSTMLNINLTPNDADVFVIDVTTDGFNAMRIENDLDSMGYPVYVTNIFPDTSEMWEYNMIILSAGGDSSIASEEMLSALLDYRYSGGRIIFEAGDLAYEVIRGAYDDIYKTDLLHLSSWIHDIPGDSGLTINSLAEDSIPYYYPNLLGLRYSTYSGLASITNYDVITPADDAYLLYSRVVNENEGCLVVYPDAEHRGFARSVYFAMSYTEAFESITASPYIFANLVEFVLPPVQNTGIVYGRVTLAPHETPGNLTQITASGTEEATDSTFADGRFAFSAGNDEYTVSFLRTGYRDTSIVIEMNQFYPVFIRMSLTSTGSVHEILPEKLYVGIPVPNPFNGAVSIDFCNPGGENILARIFNITGKNIADFDIGRELSGTFIWRPEQKTPSGMYFMIISIGQNTEIRKALFVR